MSATVPHLAAVNVLYELRRGPTRTTAIDKRPVDGPVPVGPLGLTGDRQCDTRYHGGPDKALYAYAAEDAAWWGAELGREIPPGLFGENLTTRGVDVTGALIGERWRIGDRVVVEVRQPRIPCGNFTARMGERAWVRRFTAGGRPGAYLKVLVAGSVAAGDPVTVEYRPDHDATVGVVFDRPPADTMRRLLDSGVEVCDDLVRRARRIVRRGA